MCSRFDLNCDIRAFQVQLGLDMEDIRRMTAGDKGNKDTHAVDPANTADDIPGDIPDAVPSPDDPPLAEAAFDDLTGPRHPSDPIAVILPARRVAIRKWGLTVPGLKAPLINARAETLDRKPTFRPLLGRRCLIPATGWYEWRKDGTAKHKNRITLPDHQPFLFAGLENGQEATIITCAPSGAIAHIHDRMPAVIGPNHLDGWLDPGLSFAEIRHMLGPVPDHVLSWHEETPHPVQPGQDGSPIDLFAK